MMYYSIVYIALLIILAIFYPVYMGKKWSTGEIDGYRFGVAGSICVYCIYTVVYPMFKNF